MLKIKEFIFSKDEIEYIQEYNNGICVSLKGHDILINIKNAIFDDIKEWKAGD